MNSVDIIALAAVILGPTGIWGIRTLLDRKKEPVTAADVPPPPAIIDPQTTVLQSQYSALTGLLGELAGRVDVLERERDAALRDQAYSDAIAEAALRGKAIAEEYAVELRQHIMDRREPPPPDWPVGWVHNQKRNG